MGTYGLEGVMLAWKTDKLTTEQAIGQVLQILREMEKRVATLERAITWSKASPQKAEALSPSNIPEEPVIQSAVSTEPAVSDSPIPITERQEPKPTEQE